MVGSPNSKRTGSAHLPNRFERVRFEFDPEIDHDLNSEEDSLSKTTATEWFEDQSCSIVSTNESPDVPFRYSINPYRGCEHGCAYCYARPSHEYLGWNAGLDFESKILVKRDAPALLRQWLDRPQWTGEHLALSGVTDPYQPIERKLKLTRSLLEVGVAYQQAMTVITKNAMIERDTDLLQTLARDRLTAVALSVTTLDPELARVMEPRCSTPAARLRAIETLTKAGIPVMVNVAPVIPGLNDHEIPAILEAAANAGALRAGMILLRLPGAVEPVFLDWLERHYPQSKDKVVSRIRNTRQGKLNQSDFRERMRGVGVIAKQIRQTFEVFRAKHGLHGPEIELDYSRFQVPRSKHGQLRLF